MWRSRFSRAWAAVASAVVATSVIAGSVAASSPVQATEELAPIVFVHGQSGSAQQYETQAMRFASNGYPQDLLYAFEYDTSVGTNPLAALDAFLDDVLDETGASQVNAIGHSRGTSVWTEYLTNAAFDGPNKVARYVNIDGRTLPDLPGGVPTIGIWGEWNTAGSGFNRRGDTNAQIGPDPAANFYFAGKSHTETATSAEAFALIYEFFTGVAPATTDVVPEPPGRVTISGRAVLFPENRGYAGSTLELWQIDPDTGRRIGRPREVASIDESGAFGPFGVNARRQYELAVTRPEDGSVHHFYFEPFTRSDHFVRLNMARPGTGLEAFTARSDATTNLVVVRQRELWGDQGPTNDRLTIDGVDALTIATSPRSAVNLALFAFDHGLDGHDGIGKGELFPFTLVTFITAVDIAIAASPDASGVVPVVETPRGGQPAVVNVPNWRSTTDRITVQFADAEQLSYAEYVREGR